MRHTCVAPVQHLVHRSECATYYFETATYLGLVSATFYATRSTSSASACRVTGRATIGLSSMCSLTVARSIRIPSFCVGLLLLVSSPSTMMVLVLARLLLLHRLGVHHQCLRLLSESHPLLLQVPFPPIHRHILPLPHSPTSHRKMCKTTKMHCIRCLRET